MKASTFSLLINQPLGLDSTWLPGRENVVAHKISHMSKDNLMSTRSLLQACQFLASYCRYHPLLDLSLWILHFLVASPEEIPGPLRIHAHFSPAENVTWTSYATWSSNPHYPAPTRATGTNQWHAVPWILHKEAPYYLQQSNKALSNATL